MAPFIKGQGGRKKGSLNKATIAKRLAQAEAALARQKELEASGQATEMPLDYMLRVMRDPVVDPARRDDGSERRSLLPSPVASDRAQAGR